MRKLIKLSVPFCFHLQTMGNNNDYIIGLRYKKHIYDTNKALKIVPEL
jgi:hypothetical protein